jgi:uncharacterized protein YndB with AHSA1/START domain
MTQTVTRPVVHSTFRIERQYKVPPARVFFAYSDTAAKLRWMVEGDGFEVFEYKADFRIGGGEYARFSYRGGPEMLMVFTYQDIVPNERLIYSYRMTLGGAPISASLTTIELTSADGGSTLLVLTEQGAYLDGSDDGTGREHGMRELLESLAKEIGG